MKGIRRTQEGRQRVRKVLYMAAMTASSNNPILTTFYNKLVERGKPKKVAIIAVARKLVVLANRIAADPEFKLA